MRTATGTGPAAAPASSAEASATPREFLLELKRRFVNEGPAAAAAYYDRFGLANASRLTGRDRVALEEIMHIADTVAELEATG